MDDGLDDIGISANGFFGLAWVLGLVAAGSLLRLAVHAANETPVDAGLFVWALLGTIAAVFSACCALLAGLKAAEQRMRRPLRMPAE